VRRTCAHRLTRRLAFCALDTRFADRALLRYLSRCISEPRTDGRSEPSSSQPHQTRLAPGWQWDPGLQGSSLKRGLTGHGSAEADSSIPCWKLGLWWRSARLHNWDSWAAENTCSRWWWCPRASSALGDGRKRGPRSALGIKGGLHAIYQPLPLLRPHRCTDPTRG
jgi:hypothetical protein